MESRRRKAKWVPSIAEPAQSLSVSPMSEVTGILSAIYQGDANAASQFLPLVYDELRRLEVFGRGGFGIVFRAFDETLQRVVAVKVLAPQLAASSPPRKWFVRETRSSANVRHENIVQVLAVEEQLLPYLVMEFIPGEILQQRLDRTGPLETAEVVRIGRQIAEGLAAAHGMGLIHRDIKPANILIEAGPNQCVKITDFGLARAADDASLTQSGLLAGTPMYMAPEQAQAKNCSSLTLQGFGKKFTCSGSQVLFLSRPMSAEHRQSRQKTRQKGKSGRQRAPNPRV
jgi:serine/threonine protein kinase